MIQSVNKKTMSAVYHPIQWTAQNWQYISKLNTAVPAVRPFWSSCLTALHRWGGSWDVMNWNSPHTRRHHSQTY